MEIIKPRTLYEVKDSIKNSIPQGSMRGPAMVRARHSGSITNVLPLRVARHALRALLDSSLSNISTTPMAALTRQC